MLRICSKLANYKRVNHKHGVSEMCAFLSICGEFLKKILFIAYPGIVSLLYWKHVPSAALTQSNMPSLFKRSNKRRKLKLFLLICQDLRHYLWGNFSLSQILCWNLGHCFPFSYSVLLLLVTRLIINLNAPRFTLCPHLHLFFVFLLLTTCAMMHRSPFLDLPVPHKNTS